MLFDKPLREHPPFLQIMLLLMLCLMTGGLLAYLAISTSAWFGNFNMQDLLEGKLLDPSAVPLLWYIQGLSALGAFVIPGLIFAYYWNFDKPWEPLGFHQPIKPKHYGLTLLLMLFSIPLVYGIYSFNQQINLPSGWEALEKSWKIQEDKAAATIQLMLSTPGMFALAINVLILVLLPAFGEELIFRGLLQRILHQASSNHHLAIWLTAILFSAIHMQWYGFLPRMLLGAGFGYLAVWSGSLLPAIFGHLLNNSMALLGEHALQKGWLPGGEAWLEQLPIWLVLLSLSCTFGLMWAFYKSSTTRVA